MVSKWERGIYIFFLSGSTSAALGKCNMTLFGLNPIIVKGGAHTYNMIKDEQLPKKCHEEGYRCSNLLKPHRLMVKIKEETYATEQGVRNGKNKKRNLCNRTRRWKSNWSGETVSFLVRHSVLARHCCTSTSFVGSSDHLLSLELRKWVRTSC